MLGAFVGGKLVSYRVLFLVSMAFQIVACFVLINPTETSLYIGLTIFLVATGINVPTINMMLTQRLQNDHPRREKAFLWNYAGSNIGFFFGYTASGYFQLDHAYSQLFMVASVFNIIAFLIAVAGWKSLEDINTSLIDALNERGTKIMIKKSLYLSLILLALLGIIYVSLMFPFSLKLTVLVLSVALLSFFYWLSLQQKLIIERKMIQVYIVLAIFAANLSEPSIPLKSTRFQQPFRAVF